MNFPTANSPRLLRFAAAAVALAAAPRANAAAPPPEMLPALVVTAARDAQPLARTPFAVDLFSGAQLRASAAPNVDDVLRASPAFSLFRRSGSFSANPTAQGVSLRGIGPSGASRALVLLDGVPLNDPFGGWVAWSKVPRLTLGGAEILRGGGSGAWGNAALGGVVQLLSEPARAGSGAFAAELGSLSTRRAEAFATFAAGSGAALRVGGRAFATDGFVPLSSAQRGPVDRSLASRHRLLHADYALALPSAWKLSAGGRWFDESRNNGTALQRNDSRESSGRLRLSGPLGTNATLDVLAYAQRQHFASTFSAANAARTTETPALDQFDVPATAFGGAAVATLEDAAGATTTVGADARQVSGATHEDFLFGGGVFQRRRIAGGDQLIGGAFLTHRRALAPSLDAQFAVRLDRWKNTGGHRTETAKATGAVVRDDRVAGRNGTQFNPNLGLVWRVRDDLRFRTAAYRAFRLPTLNEYHRPFRVGTVSTEANPALRLETVTAGDAGFVFARRAWELSGGVFANELRDAVANVTLSSTPALTARQRLNLDRVAVRGIEARLAWRPAPAFRASLDYLHSDARVEAATVAPALAGRRLAQVPRHSATLQLGWQPHAAWTVSAAARASSAQFEDDENQLRLAPAFTGDVAVTWRIGAHRTLGLAVENAGDARVETGRGGDGLVGLGAPRTFRGGITQEW